MRLITSLAIIFIGFQNLDCYHNGRKSSARLNFFDIELLRVTTENTNGNVMISPASIKSTLAVLLAGADGNTAKEIEDALRLSSVKEELREQLYSYHSALQTNTSTAVLHNANGIFVSEKLKLKPNFGAVASTAYQSDITKIDYSNPNAAAVVINTWVSNKTNGLVPLIVDPVHVTPSSDFILASALYFKSPWLHAFDPSQTKRSCFYRNGDCIMVDMMNLETNLNYAHVEDLKAHAVELPYEGKRYSMVILAPLEKDGLGGLIRDLPYVSLWQIFDLLRPTDVMLSLPKFTVNYEEDIVEALTKLHIKDLFSNKSNLTGIFEGTPPHVNSFQHKVFMSVDETGTVAAASSTAFVVPLMFDGTVQVKADRPFLFFIRDNEFGITLFEGKVEELSALDHVPSDNVPVKPANPPVENKMSVQTVQSSNSNPQLKPKSSSFLESIRNIFG